VNPESQQEQRPHRKRGPQRKFDDEFRRNALEQMKTSTNVTELARQLGIRRKWQYHWRDEATGRVSEPRRQQKRSPRPSPRVAKTSGSLNWSA
jgi:transposase-like protein